MENFSARPRVYNSAMKLYCFNTESYIFNIFTALMRIVWMDTVGRWMLDCHCTDNDSYSSHLHHLPTPVIAVDLDFTQLGFNIYSVDLQIFINLNYSVTDLGRPAPASAR